LDRYAHFEKKYSEPIADGIAHNARFRAWLLKHTKFGHQAKVALPLIEEMQKKRSKSAQTWWGSHYTESCRCTGCSGQETDLLVVFEGDSSRFALHVEIKQPTDNFPTHKDQAESYAIRAECWIGKPPKAIVPHFAADTMLICGENRLADYEVHLPKFGSVITFEEIAASFPDMAIGAT
jgi:hypothetical protein